MAIGKALISQKASHGVTAATVREATALTAATVREVTGLIAAPSEPAAGLRAGVRTRGEPDRVGRTEEVHHVEIATARERAEWTLSPDWWMGRSDCRGDV